MANVRELDDAIGAHGRWKTNLKNAIATGKIETSIETIRVDNQCTFGKWLYGGTLTPKDKASSHYGIVKNLHAEFHKTAACVAELAVTGKKAEAEKMMALGGEFASISSKLTRAMMDWKEVSK